MEEMSRKMFGDIMRQAQAFQEKLMKLQEEAGKRTVEASAGGGMVTVVANGRQEILSIKIDPEVMKSGDVEMLQDLVMAAVNEVLKKAQAMMAEEMKGVTGGLQIPGLL
jgi:DNA-binding YbaB/EbfC family protein